MRKLLELLCVCAWAVVTAGAQDVGSDYVASAAIQAVIYHGKEQLKYSTSKEITLIGRTRDMYPATLASKAFSTRT